MKEKLRDYFYFTGSEKKGIFVLSLLIILVATVPGMIRKRFPGNGTDGDGLKYAQMAREWPETRAVGRSGGQDLPGRESTAAGKGRPVPTDAERTELNQADSLDLLAVPGIGPYTARKILRYRSRLGGFFTAEQLLEVDGMTKERFDLISPHLRVDPDRVVLIDINTVEFKDLLRHPYAGPAVTKAIIRFRMQYGEITDPEEIRKSSIIPDSLYSRIRPYLNIK